MDFRISKILEDFADAGYPLFDGMGPYIDRLMSEGMCIKLARIELIAAYCDDHGISYEDLQEEMA